MTVHRNTAIGDSRRAGQSSSRLLIRAGRFSAHHWSVSRVFLSHSSRDSVAALALKIWLERAEPGLVDEIFLDLDPDTGIPAGVRWKEALRRANERCEAVICLLSQHWDSSARMQGRVPHRRGPG